MCGLKTHFKLNEIRGHKKEQYIKDNTICIIQFLA